MGRSPPRADTRVLNAFRHHRGRHWLPGAMLPAISHVLNAFRHHRGRHDSSRRRHRTYVLCSTPFGITEVGILCLPGGDGALGWCSTPFGITEVGICRPGRAPSRTCAQRLSASQRSAYCSILGKSVLECSTPFGITEVGMLLVTRRLEGLDRCSTPFGITEVGMPTRCRHSTTCRCSTPFGITEVGIVRGWVESCRVCSTPFGITEVGIGRWRSGWRRQVGCSTPFGITEVGICRGGGE